MTNGVQACLILSEGGKNAFHTNFPSSFHLGGIFFYFYFLLFQWKDCLLVEVLLILLFFTPNSHTT